MKFYLGYFLKIKIPRPFSNSEDGIQMFSILIISTSGKFGNTEEANSRSLFLAYSFHPSSSLFENLASFVRALGLL